MNQTKMTDFVKEPEPDFIPPASPDTYDNPNEIVDNGLSNITHTSKQPKMKSYFSQAKSLASSYISPKKVESETIPNELDQKQYNPNLVKMKVPKQKPKS